MSLSRLPVHILSGNREILTYLKQLLPSSIEVKDIPYEAKEKDPVHVTEESMATLRDAQILFTDPGLIAEVCKPHDLPNLKWMQSTWAGVQQLTAQVREAGVVPSFKLTRAHGIFGDLMAEYVLGQILVHERRFCEMSKENQWNFTKYKNYRILSSLSLGILGVGSIGKEVARIAKSFGMTVWGLTSQEGAPKNVCPYVDEYRGPSGLSTLLSECDYVCNILPSTPNTKGLLSGDVLSSCQKKNGVFINVGRGDVCDEESILKALREGWIGGAILDVFENEPLGDDSRLWTQPGVVISPHVSALTLVRPVVDLFIKNYNLFHQGEPLIGEVDWAANY